MNQARKQSMITGLSSIARKVFEAVPIREQWTITQVMTELGRHGAAPERNKVEGCIASLLDQRLIRVSYDGPTAYYRRDPARPTLRMAGADDAQDADETPAPDPMTNLANMAQQLRDKAAELVALADKIDAAALDVADAMESAGSEGAKFRQLKDLLASITN